MEEAYQQLQSEIAERKPNRYAANALFMVLIALLFACLLNEAGIFEVDRGMIWSCFAIAVLCCAAAQYLARSKQFCTCPGSKYIIISISLLLILTVTVFLNINVVLLTIFPMLLATRYRSERVSWIAVIGSCVCSVAAPVLAWRVGSWSQTYLTGLLENTCHISVLATGAPAVSPWVELRNLLLYLCLPQLMVVVIFGRMIMSITQTGIRSLSDQIQVLKMRDNLNRELERVVSMQDRILYAMADIIESRDTATGNHVKRTSRIVALLVEEMQKDPARQLPEEFCSAVIKAAPLHDIGKISVEDALLRKPGKLTDPERAVIQQHSSKSAEIIRSILVGLEDATFLDIAVNLAKYHHEWYNGAGYPEKLRGQDIPLEARIMAIADVYDALVSKRSYKEPMSHQEAFQIIENAMGTQFDPALNPYFTAVYPKIKEIYQE